MSLATWASSMGEDGALTERILHILHLLWETIMNTRWSCKVIWKWNDTGKKSGNEQFLSELRKWVFHERGHLKFIDVATSQGWGRHGWTVISRSCHNCHIFPEYGAIMGFFPVNHVTLRYLKLTGRSDEFVSMIESYWWALHWNRNCKQTCWTVRREFRGMVQKGRRSWGCDQSFRNTFQSSWKWL